MRRSRHRHPPPELSVCAADQERRNIRLDQRPDLHGHAWWKASNAGAADTPILGIIAMIYIIGTRHSLQVWTDFVRKGESLDARPQDVTAFESYLLNSAQSLRADIIAEEASDEWVAGHGHGASSVAKDVATRLGIKHLFCDPDTAQRQSIGLKVGEELHAHIAKIAKETETPLTDVHNAQVRMQFSTREAVWLERLEGCDPNNRSVIFVCGANHVDSFKDRLHSKQILAEIHCADWTEGTKG